MPVLSSERAPSGFRADVQGLRAIAVGLVILYHYGLVGCSGGFIGVDVFFVISGFVIAGVIFREVRSEGRLNLLGFYARRARRILPASALTLAVTVVASVILLGQLGTFDIAHDAVAASLFMANFHFAAQGINYFASNQTSPLLHFWSLAVEEQFYFFIPTLMVLIVRFGSRIRRDAVVVVGVVTAASFGYSIYLTHYSPVSAYYSISTRAWELGLGVMVAGVIHRFGRLRGFVALAGSWTGFALIVYSAWTFTRLTPYPGSAAGLPVLGAALVILCGATTTRFGTGRLLQTRPFVYVGDISYSLYLWHFPVIVLAARYWGVPQGLTSRIVLLAVAVTLSVLSYQFIENPVRLSKRLKQSVTQSLGLGVACVTVAVVVAILPTATLDTGASVTIGGTPALHSLHLQIAAATKIHNLPAATDPGLTPSLSLSYFSLPALLQQCAPVPGFSYIPVCSFGELLSRRVVVLYGNSQAQMWAPTFDLLGRRDHYRLVVFAKPACGTFLEHGYIDPLGRVSSICLDFVHWAIPRIVALHPVTVIVASTLGNLLRRGANPNQLGPDGRLASELLVLPTAQQAATSFVSLVNALQPSGAKVVLIGNIAVPPGGKYPGATTPNGCLLAHTHDLQRCSLPTPTLAKSKNRFELIGSASAARVPFINVDPLMCAFGFCPPVVHRILVHFDTLHISSPYARYVSSGMRELLGTNLP